MTISFAKWGMYLQDWRLRSSGSKCYIKLFLQLEILWGLSALQIFCVRSSINSVLFLAIFFFCDDSKSIIIFEMSTLLSSWTEKWAIMQQFTRKDRWYYLSYFQRKEVKNRYELWLWMLKLPFPVTKLDQNTNHQVCIRLCYCFRA